MRIIGSIDHPLCKITVFQLDHKYAIKFEENLYEQTYKMRTSSQINGMNDIRKMVDEPFIKRVRSRFIKMHHDIAQSFERNLAPEREDDFDEII